MTLEVGKFISGSMFGLPDDSFFGFAEDHVFVATGSLATDRDLYNYTLGINLPLGIFSSEGTDLWVLSAGVTTTVISATVMAGIAFDDRTDSRGISFGASSLAQTPIYTWDSFLDAASDNWGAQQSPLRPFRVPRGFNLRFESRVTAAATVRFRMALQAVPAGMQPSVWL